MAPPKTEDELRLERLFDEVLKPILRQHNVSGVIVLASEKSTAWTVVFARWSGLQVQPSADPSEPSTVQLRLGRQAAPGVHQDGTMGMIAAYRECFSDLANLFGGLWRGARTQIQEKGGQVDHTPYGGGHGIFPAGRKGD